MSNVLGGMSDGGMSPENFKEEREARIEKVLFGDFINYFFIFSREYSFFLDRPPNEYVVPTFLSMYGDGGSQSYLFKIFGGPITQNDLDSHPLKTIFQEIDVIIDLIRSELQANNLEKMYAHVDKLFSILLQKNT